MEPITTTFIALGASALAGGLGFVLGRRTEDESETTVPATSPTLAEKASLERAYKAREQALLELFGANLGELPDAKDLTNRLDALRAQLVEFDADKRVSAVAAFDERGLMLLGDDTRQRERVLGSLVAATRCLDLWGAGAREITWRDGFGNVLTLLEVGRKDPVYVGIWTQGRAVSRAAIGRVRFALEGKPAALDESSAATLSEHALRRRDAPDALAALAGNVNLIGVTTSLAAMPLFSHGDHLPLPEGFDRKRAVDVLTGISHLESRLGAFSSLELRGFRQQTRFAVLDSNERDSFSVTVTLPVGDPAPESSFDAMLGRLTWELPEYLKSLDIPLRADRPTTGPLRIAPPETSAPTASSL